MNDIARNIKKLRKGAGLTQDELAEKLYVTRQAVSNWENSKTQPDIDTLFSLAKALDCDISELLYGEKASEPPYEKMQRKYILLSIICVLIICISFPLGSFADTYASRYYDPVYKLIYFAYMLLVYFSAAVLCLSVISMFADISIKNKPARRAMMTLFVIAVSLITLFWIGLFADSKGALGNFGEIIIAMIGKPVTLYIPSEIAGAALFTALNK